MQKPMAMRRSVQAQGSAISGKAISPADMKEPSAAKTRTWPTLRISRGASCAPERKPKK
jgi:hypothetical protein